MGASAALALALLCAPSTSAAQARRAALWIEGDEAQTASVRVIVRGALTAAGYELEAQEPVEAARAFVSAEPSFDDASAARLRESLGVDVLVVVRTEPRADGAVAVQVRRWTASGHEAEDGTATAAEVGGFVVERVVRWERATSESAVPPEAPAVATNAPVATDAPAATNAADTPDAAVATNAAVVVAAAGGAPHATPPTEAQEPPPPARTMRLRLALVAVAGINGYGYGAGARLLLPLARAGRGDNALSLGVDLSATYDETAIDLRGEYASDATIDHVQRAFQLPLTLSLAWRVNTGALVVTPRVGVIGVLRFAGVEGSTIRGFRLDALLMGLLGLSFGIWLHEDIQLFLGADAMAGPRRDIGADNDTLKDLSRFGLLLSAGVAL